MTNTILSNHHRINIKTDSLMTAVSKKLNNTSLSNKTLSKLVSIAKQEYGLKDTEAKNIFFNNPAKVKFDAIEVHALEKVIHCFNQISQRSQLESAFMYAKVQDWKNNASYLLECKEILNWKNNASYLLEGKEILNKNKEEYLSEELNSINNQDEVVKITKGVPQEVLHYEATMSNNVKNSLFNNELATAEMAIDTSLPQQEYSSNTYNECRENEYKDPIYSEPHDSQSNIYSDPYENKPTAPIPLPRKKLKQQL